jgi:signal transduction histidine kinase/DNA-binding response OmpR family regulator
MDPPPATLTHPALTPAPRTPGAPQVLILDDQQSIRNLLRDVLEANGYHVSLAQNIGEADALLEREPFDTVMVDIFLGAHERGLSLLPRIAKLQPQTPTIVISGMANMDHVIEALKAGAYDMLLKPFNIMDVLHVVARAVEKKRMAEENVRLVEALRRERDLLELRVRAATCDLEEKVETLRQVNQQISTMFEMSQMPSGDGSSEGLIRNIFESMRRIIDFEGAFCVVYDIKAVDITLTHSEGPAMKGFCEAMTALFRDQGGALVELAESEEHLPIMNLQAAIRQLFPGAWPGEDIMLMPLHVHQTLMGVVGVLRGQRATHLTQVEERILALAISHFLAALEQRSFIARTGQLAGLGELISEIAHDLRHPMTALRGASHILEGGWRDEAKRNRCLDEIQNNLGRMESLVSELVNFYNPKEMNMVPVDVHALLDKALAIGGPLLEQKRIEVVRQFGGAPLRILGLTRNLIEAFINLIANACQAMADGGRLRLATTAELSEAQRHRLRQQGRQPGNYILIKIEDNGCGIPDEHKERVFHRFFTTRPEGHGLGLAAVQRIIKKNLGHVDLESQVGVGTTFFLFLPKA